MTTRFYKERENVYNRLLHQLKNVFNFGQLTEFAKLTSPLVSKRETTAFARR